MNTLITILLIAAAVAGAYVFVFGLCRAAGEADEAAERLYREWLERNRKS